MITRRIMILAAFCVGLAGCDTGPLLESDSDRKYHLNKLTVDTSSVAKVTGRVNNFAREKVRRDVQANLHSKLTQRAKGPQPANVHVTITGVHLVSPGQALLIGGTSAISGSVQVTDAKTGSVILPATPVYGTAKGTYAPGGVLGAVTTRSVEGDYKATVVGFSNDVELRLFGNVAEVKETTPTVKEGGACG